MTADAVQPPADPKPQSKARRWRRRLMIALVVIIVLAVIVRALINILLPTVLRKIAAGYDLDCDYERSELNLVNGDAALWHLTFTPKGGSEPILSLGYVRGNISTLALLRGALEIWRMEADGVNVTLERAADGRIPLLERLQAATANAPPPTTASSVPGKIDLTPPARIDAFRLTQVRARVIDRSVTPIVDSTISLSVRVSDVQSPVRPITFELGLWGDPVLDLFYVAGTGRASGKTLDADLRMRMRGFRPETAAAYLVPLGIKPSAREIAADARGHLKLSPAGNEEAVKGELVVEKVSASADGADAATVERIVVKADSISLDAAKIAELLIEGVRLSANVNSAGEPGFCGFDYVGAPPATQPAIAVVPADAPTGSPLLNLIGAYRVSVAQASVRHMTAEFNDESFITPQKLQVEFDDLTASDFAYDANAKDTIVSLSGTMRSPGLIGGVQITGKVKPFAVVPTGELSIRADGIDPQAANPYLGLLGLQSDLKDGSFTADLSGQLTTQADGTYAIDGRFNRLRFADRNELLAMNDVHVSGVRLAPQGGMSIEAIDIAGPTLRVLRDASGHVSLLGLRTGAEALPRHQPPASTQPALHDDTRLAITLPRIRVGRLTWKELKLQFEDQTLPTGAQEFSLEAGLELKNLAIHSGTTSTAPSEPGTLSAWLAAPGIVDRATIQGTIDSAGNTVTTQLNVAANGITAARLKPYLASIGIEPLLVAGQARLQAILALTQPADGSPSASLALDQVRYLDGETELAGVDKVKVQRVSLAGSQLRIAGIDIDKPRAVASRDVAGAISAVGMRMVAPPTPTTMPAADAHSRINIPKVDVKLDSLRINDASLAWSDAATPTPVSTTGQLTLIADGLAFGPNTQPARFDVAASATGIVNNFKATGTLLTSHSRAAIDVQVAADGLRAGPLAAYAPPGIEPALTDGRIRASVAASVAANADGGLEAAFSIRQVDLHEGNAKTLLKLDAFTAHISRLDLEENVLAVNELSARGFETTVRVRDDGSFELPAVLVRSVESAPAEPDAPAVTVGEDVSTLVNKARRPVMLLTLDKLDLNASRITLHGPDNSAEPVHLVDWRVNNIGRIEVGGADPETRPPTKLELAGRLDPLLGGVAVKTQLAPMAAQPSATIETTVTGIRGEGLTRILPQLEAYIDGTGMTDGRFHSHVEVVGNFNRGANRAPDLSRPFDLELKITDTKFAASGDGPALAGVEQVQAEAVHVDPRTGGVRVKRLEITKPLARAWREKDGVHALGWVIKLPTTQPMTQESAPATESAPPTEAPATVAQPSRPGAEIAIDRLVVTGLDLRVEDRAVEPAMVIPLNGLDAEVRGLSNLALFDDRTIRFNALVTSDKTPLPAIGEDSPSATEDREVFSQAVANGSIGLYPKPRGWAKLSLSGFELTSLQGIAHENSVTLGKGIFDAQIDLRLKESGDIETRSKLVMTDLQITEPPNGPIQRSLALPGTLDLAIKALQDPDGSITIPLSVPIRAGQISPADIVGAGAGALLSVITTAMVSTPLKPIAGVADLLGGGKEATPQTVTVPFAPGALSLDAGQRKPLDQLIERLRKDKNLQLTLRHELGGGDLDRARLLANPTRDERVELAARLRAQKFSLLEQRAHLAGQGRAAVASLPRADAATVVAQLQDLDRTIAATEDALDRAYDLLKPGADRQADRRTRAATLEIAQARLDATQRYLLSGVGAATAERISAVAPTFAPPDNDAGGTIQITLVAKKRQ